jgi:hypothetical protein
MMSNETIQKFAQSLILATISEMMQDGYGAIQQSNIRFSPD